MDNVSGLPTNIKIGSNNKKGDFENPSSDTDTPLFQSFLVPKYSFIDLYTIVNRKIRKMVEEIFFGRLIEIFSSGT